MNEIKAYVRPEQVEQVVRALRDAGVPHMTVTHVRSLGSGVDPEHMRVSLETGGWYTETAKIEFVCAEREVDRLVRSVQDNARTGKRGDGIIFAHQVDRAVKILTGAEGPSALK